MFELIKIILEPLLKSISIPQLLERREKKQIRQIGTELFILYSLVNEIIVRGHMIIERLEEAVRLAEQRTESDWLEAPPIPVAVKDLLEKQGYCLWNAVRAFDRLGLELQIIDGPAYRSIDHAIPIKSTTIERLLELCRPSEDSLVAFEIGKLEAALYDQANAGETFPKNLPSITYSALSELLGARTVLVRDTSTVTASRIAEIKAYLAASQPREQLTALETALADLRVGLEKNFSVADVLLEVRDRRVRY